MKKAVGRQSGQPSARNKEKPIYFVLLLGERQVGNLPFRAKS